MSELHWSPLGSAKVRKRGNMRGHGNTTLKWIRGEFKTRNPRARIWKEGRQRNNIIRLWVHRSSGQLLHSQAHARLCFTEWQVCDVWCMEDLRGHRLAHLLQCGLAFMRSSAFPSRPRTTWPSLLQWPSLCRVLRERPAGSYKLVGMVLDTSLPPLTKTMSNVRAAAIPYMFASPRSSMMSDTGRIS